MSADEFRERLSEHFDEITDHENCAASECRDDWETWSLVARHLESQEVVTLPGAFASEVQKAIARARFRSDLVLVLQTGLVTALVVTLVVAGALGFDWWHRLHTILESANPAAFIAKFLALLETTGALLAGIFQAAAPAWKLLPVALITAATGAVLIELAVFWILRIGPFRPNPQNCSPEL